MQIFGIELMGSQLILSVIVLFLLLKTYIGFKKKEISFSFSVVWCVFWLGVLFVIYYPGFLSGIASKLGIGRGVDLAVYLSVILLFYLIYKMSIKFQNLERQITKIARDITIKNEKK